MSAPSGRMRARAAVAGLGTLGLVGSVFLGVALGQQCRLPQIEGTWTDLGTNLVVKLSYEIPQGVFGQTMWGQPRVKATYVAPHYCRYPDPQGQKVALQTDFEGDLTVIGKVGQWRIKSGTLHMCKHDYTHTTGPYEAPLRLTLTERDSSHKTLDGDFTDHDGTKPEIHLVLKSLDLTTPLSRNPIPAACPSDDPGGSTAESPGVDLWTPLVDSEKAKHGRGGE